MDNDLISRSALKKVIKSYADDQYAENEYLGEGAIMDIIDNALAVNRFYDYNEGYKDGFSLCFKRGSELNERPQGEWILVSERLPEKEGFYLVFLENEQMAVAHSDGIIANHDFEPKMLAWMPLPELYKNCGADMGGKEE